MINVLRVLFTLLIPVCVLAAPPITIKEPFYQFQAGITGGVNIAGSPVNGTGIHYGLMVRRGNHAGGVRYEREKNIEGAYPRRVMEHRKTGGFYSFTFAMEHFQWGPQIGIGQLVYDYREIASNQYTNVFVDTDTYFELAVYGLAGARGNGIGGKVFVLFSSIEKYVGFTLFLQAGYAWNSK